MTLKLIDSGVNGNVYGTIPDPLVEEFYSDIVSTIILRGGYIERNCQAITTSSRYIRGFIEGVRLNIRISSHTKRRRGHISIQPYKWVGDGYKCEVLSYSSFTCVNNLIKSL